MDGVLKMSECGGNESHDFYFVQQWKISRAGLLNDIPFVCVKFSSSQMYTQKINMVLYA